MQEQSNIGPPGEAAPAHLKPYAPELREAESPVKLAVARFNKDGLAIVTLASAGHKVQMAILAWDGATPGEIRRIIDTTEDVIQKSLAHKLRQAGRSGLEIVKYVGTHAR